MKNLFRRKEKPIEPAEKRFCRKGHEVPYGTATYLHIKDIHSDWLCPQCLVDFVNGIASIKEPSPKE